MFSSLVIPLDAENLNPHKLDISQISLSSRPKGDMAKQKKEPLDLELLNEAIAAAEHI